MMFGDVGVKRYAVYVLKSVGESTPPCALWDSCFCVPECGFVVVVKCILFVSLDVICYVFEYCVGDDSAV